MRRESGTYNMLTLNAYWLGLSFMWNSIHPLILPLLILELGSNVPNTAYGMLTFIGLVVALVVQPISGALSDYTESAWGRRRPWIVAGTLLDIFWLAALVLSRTFLGVATAYVGLQLCSNLAHGPAQGLIPDLVPEDRHGVASGVKGLMEMLGVIAASLTISRLVGSSRAGLLVAISLVSLLLLAGLAITVLGIREEPHVREGHATHNSLKSQLRAIIQVDIRAHAGYTQLLLSRFCIFLGSYTVQSFGYFYFMDVLKIEDPARTVGNLMTIIGISVLVSVYPAGLLSEHWGRKRLSLAACAVVAVGMALLAVLREPEWIPVLGVAIGVGMGTFNSVNWAWATDLVPANEAGKYLGLSNLATAGSAAISRLFGPLVDLINRWAAPAGYMLLFVVATLGALAGLWITLRVPEVHLPTRASAPPE